MARSYGGARSPSAAGIGGAGVIAARAAMDQRSEGAGGTAQRYQLPLSESGVAAPVLHLGARVNASPPGAHGEVEGVDGARPVAGGVASSERIDHN
jgi:hypothetical protein